MEAVKMKMVGVFCSLMLLVVGLATSQTNVTIASKGASPRVKAVILNVGAWDTMLQPWFTNETNVINTIAKTDFDVLALEGVWTATAKDHIILNRQVKAKYKYSYYAPAMQEAGSCPNFVPRVNMEDYINCLTATGVDTHTVEQAVPAVDISCKALGVILTLIDQDCAACIENTMQDFDALTPPLTAIDRCLAGTGSKYAHGGVSGHLILSKKALQNVVVLPYTTFMVKRVTIEASVAGVKFAFVHFAKNYLQDFNPAYGPFMTGTFQPDMASDIVSNVPDVVIGETNSGPDYQPDGHNLLVQAGYAPLFSKPTYCPAATHASLAQCVAGELGPLTIDNIYVKKNEGLCLPYRFAEKPVSDHIGVAAVCGLLTH